jgi:galactose-1-phosphate uridylyltransferase
MSVRFEKSLKETHFLDPNQDFQPGSQRTEIRIDPLTGRTGRILYFPLRIPQKPDLASLVQTSLELGCPFCPQVVEKVTPKFLPELVPEGRVQVGEALVFPNMFPYDTFSAVGIFSGQHFVPLTGFTQELLTNGLLAAQQFLQRALGPQHPYGSINWNYMPLSGGSIVHPHLQVIAGDVPTNYLRETLAASQDYLREKGSVFWADLLRAEQQRGERYVGATGGIHWLTSFVPKGYMDILALFPQGRSLEELTAQDLADFARGLLAVFAYLDSKDLWSFNLALYPAPAGEASFWTHARIVPRFTFSPVNTSDIRYTEVLHDEVVTTLKPEEVCAELRGMFP